MKFRPLLRHTSFFDEGIQIYLVYFALSTIVRNCIPNSESSAPTSMRSIIDICWKSFLMASSFFKKACIGRGLYSDIIVGSPPIS